MFNNRIAVLFIHGFVGGNYDYANFPNELEVRKKFDVFTFTLPGHDKIIVKMSNLKNGFPLLKNKLIFY